MTNQHLVNDYTAFKTHLFRYVTVALALLLVASCTGEIDSSIEAPEEVIDVPPDSEIPELAPAPSTPLARLTNEEYLRSLTRVLELPVDAPELTEALALLPAEPSIGGLTNDAANQVLTQVAISGFERLASAAADAFLADVSDNDDLAARLGCESMGTEAISPCLAEFGHDLVARATRSGPSDEHALTVATVLSAVDEMLIYEEQDRQTFQSRELALRSLIQYVALAPEFLLLIERGTEPSDAAKEMPRLLTQHEIATRLAFFISGAPPDETLLEEASAGRLSNAEVRAQQVDRLLDTPTGQAQFTSAITGWLGVEKNVADPDNLALLSDFVLDWLVSDRPFREFYEASVPVAHLDGDTSMEPFGVLGTQAFIESHTSHPTPDFITRGIFVVDTLLCGELPDGVPADALGTEGMTAAEVFQNHTKQPCASCHVVFDNYGAAFQQFDPETNLYDPTRTPFGNGFALYEVADVSGTVTDVADLAATIANSERAPTCMAELFYRHAMRRSLDTEGGDNPTMERLVSSWLASDTSLKALLREIAASEEFITLIE